MAIPSNVIEILKEKLEGEKIGDVSAAEYFIDALEYNDKLKAANADLVNQRKEFEAEKGQYNTQVKQLLEEKEGLESKVNELSGIKDNSGNLQKLLDAEREKRAVEVAELNKKIDLIIESKKESDLKARESVLRSEEEKLYSEISKSLTERNILGKNLDLSLKSIRYDGLAKVLENDGKHERSIIVNDGGRDVSMSVDELADYFAKNNESLVSPPNKQGAGETHNRKNNLEFSNFQNASADIKIDSMLSVFDE